MEQVVLFGGGKDAERIIRDLYDHGKQSVIAIIDNNKHGTSRESIPYISLDNYKSDYKNYDVIIASKDYAHEMIKQLKESQVFNYTIPSILFEDNLVAHDEEICHDNWPKYLKELMDYPGKNVLEVGSRKVVGDIKHWFTNANYTGFDIYPGENVDVVGDAHKLSSFFDCKFDLIYSSAVFEHLAMPWIVSTEIIKLLKPGGYVFIETHYSYSSHERPWHFFQFSENALNILFPEEFGIKCLKKGCSNLIEGRFSDKSSEYLQGRLVNGLYCHSEFLGQKVSEVSEYRWENLDLENLVNGTNYPRKQ